MPAGEHQGLPAVKEKMRFHELVDHLVAEHDREVRELNDRINSCLRGCSCRQATPALEDDASDAWTSQTDARFGSGRSPEAERGRGPVFAIAIHSSWLSEIEEDDEENEGGRKGSRAQLPVPRTQTCVFASKAKVEVAPCSAGAPAGGAGGPSLPDEVLGLSGSSQQRAVASMGSRSLSSLDQEAVGSQTLGALCSSASLSSSRPSNRLMLPPPEELMQVRNSVDAFAAPGRALAMLANQSGNKMLTLRTFMNLWAHYTKFTRAFIVFQLRGLWTERMAGSGESMGLQVDTQRMSSLASESSIGIDPSFRPTPLRSALQCHGWAIPPNGTQRMWWDLACLVLLIFDFVFVPLRLAFEWTPTRLMSAMDLFTLLFWTSDIFMSCRTGHVHKGATIMNARAIVRHYMRGWFVLDILILVPDWVLMGMSSNGANASEMARILRAFRITRLLRFAKLRRLVAMAHDRIDSEFTFVMLNVSKLLALLLLITHLVTSVWYAIGDVMKEKRLPNWIDSEEGLADSHSSWYAYVTAMHWSLTQFTPASMSVQPQNEVERTFAIVVLLAGLVLFSGFISTISNSMMQLSRTQDDYSKQLWLLRRYLKNHNVPRKLQFRVLRYIEYVSREEAEVVAESRINMIGKLSAQLRNELKFCVTYAVIETHPLFKKASQMMNFSIDALQIRLMVPEEVLFAMGSIATHMYMVTSGSMGYSSSMDDSSSKVCDRFTKSAPGEKVLLKELDWLAESALWVDKWMHVGRAVSTTNVKMVCIDPVKFGEMTRTDIPTYTLMCGYATRYLKWLLERRRKELTDVAICEEMQPVVSAFFREERPGIASRASFRQSWMSTFTGSAQVAQRASQRSSR